MPEGASHWVTLREHLELRAELVKLEERLRSADQALLVAKTELARRLEELNHAHRDAREKENNFLSVQRFDDYVKGQTVWREQVMVTMAANSGKWGAYGSVFATALAVASLLWNVLRAQR